MAKIFICLVAYVVPRFENEHRIKLAFSSNQGKLKETRREVCQWPAIFLTLDIAMLPDLLVSWSCYDSAYKTNNRL
jgi:hypothetical protein